jgi:hypothetical protein
LADVGATRPRSDPIDLRILSEVRKREHTYSGSKGKLPGIIDSPQDVGGLPEYRSETPPADSDHDGLPDAWEQAHRLNPQDPRDGPAFRDDGYTHLEFYLNALAGSPDAPQEH